MAKLNSHAIVMEYDRFGECVCLLERWYRRMGRFPIQIVRLFSQAAGSSASCSDSAIRPRCSNQKFHVCGSAQNSNTRRPGAHAPSTSQRDEGSAIGAAEI